MNPPRFSLIFRICIFVLFALLHGLRAEDVAADLEAFRKKVAAEEAKQSERTKQPSGFAEQGRQISMQIKMLESLVARGDYDRARQMLESIGGYGMPPQFLEEWLQLADMLGKELESQKAERLEKWAADVDLLVKDTKAGCLAAKTSADLDPLFLRCSAVQMRGERGGNVMGERTNRKLQGVVETLTAWANYLDFQNAGDGKKANDILRNLISNSSSFPVLTVDEVKSRFSPVSDERMSRSEMTAKIFDGVDSPDDLSMVVERINTYAADPINRDQGSLKDQIPRISFLMAAWKAAQAGDSATAMAAVNKYSGGGDDFEGFVVPIRAQITNRIVQDKTATWTKLAQNPGESIQAYLGRILDELKKKGDYATMLDVLAFSAQIERGAGASLGGERTAIEQFIAAQRFEKAGDGLAAITSYRIVIGLGSGRYSPAAEAQEALQRLQEKYPEAFKNAEGVLLEQIRGLSQQIQMLQNRPPYRPY